MTNNELLDIISNIQINNKTNNMIISSDNYIYVMKNIPKYSSISFKSCDINTDIALNIKIDLNEVKVNDILTYTLNYLKELKMIDTFLDYTLPFENNFNLLKFNNTLKYYDSVIQLIFYNTENLTIEENELFNELYYFNSYYFNIITFVKDNLNTYFLSNNRVLDDREDYEKIKLKTR